MNIVILGAGLAGRAAAVSLADEHHVTLLGSRRSSTINKDTVINRSLLEREGFPGETTNGIPLDFREVSRYFSFSDGKEYVGIRSSQSPDQTLRLTDRSTLSEWLLEKAIERGINHRPRTFARGLIKRQGTVKGVHTDSGSFKSDHVFIAETSPSFLTEQEGYLRKYDDESTDYLLNLRTTTEGEIENILGSPGISPSGSFTELAICLPSPEKSNMNCFIRLLNLNNDISINFYVPHESFSESHYDPSALMKWCFNLPLFEELDELKTEQDADVALHRPGGRSRWSILADHGVTIGGQAAGFGSFFPFPDYGNAALYSGYQFARSIHHLQRHDDESDCQTLRQFYPEAIESSQLGDRARQVNTWIDYFLDTDGNFSRLGPRMINIKLSEIGQTLIDSNTLFDLLPNEWILPTTIPSVKKIVMGSYEFVTGPVQFVPASKQHSMLTQYILRMFNGSLIPRDDFLGNWQVARFVSDFLTTPDKPDPEITREITESPEIPRQFQFDTTDRSSLDAPAIHLRLNSSLNMTVRDYEYLSWICPTEVYQLTNDDGSHRIVADEDECIRCGNCLIGRSPVYFTGSSYADTMDHQPRQRYLEVGCLYQQDFGDIDNKLNDVLEVARTKLEILSDDLDSMPYITPEAERWMQTQLNYMRTEFENQELSEGIENDFLDELNRLQRHLRFGEYRFAKNRLKVILDFFLEPVNSKPSGQDQSHGDSRITRNFPASSESSIESGNSADIKDTQSKVESVISERAKSFIDSLINDIVSGQNNIKPTEDASMSLAFSHNGNTVTALGHEQSSDVVLVSRNRVEQFDVTELDDTRELVSVGKVSLTKYRDSRWKDFEPYDFNPSSSQPKRPAVTENGLLEFFSDLTSDINAIVARKLVSSFEDSDVLFFCEDPSIITDWGGLQVPGFLLGSLSDSTLRDDTATVRMIALLNSLVVGPGSYLDSLQGIAETRSVAFDSPKFLRLMLLNFPLPIDRYRERLAKEDYEDYLALTDSEEELWSRGDRMGILDDVIRQWRMVTDQIRTQLKNGESTSTVQKQSLAQLWGAKRMITKLQKDLESGGRSRKKKLLLDLYMRQNFEMENLMDDERNQNDPAKNEENYSSVDEGTKSSSGKLGDLVSETFQSAETLIRSFSSYNDGSDLGRFGSYVRDLGEIWTDNVSQDDPFKRRLTAIVLKKLGRDYSGMIQTKVASTSIKNQSLTLDFVTSIETLRNHLNRVLYSRRFQNQLNQIRNVLLDQPGRLEFENMNDDEQEELTNALENYDAEVRDAINSKANLFSILDVFSRMIATLRTMESLRDHPPTDRKTNIDSMRLTPWGTRVIQSSASLFNHGVNRLRNKQDPTSAQIVDLDFPESVYERRTSSVDLSV